MRTGTNDPQLIATAERRAFVLDLRRSGANYRDIAATVIQRFGIENLPNGYDSRYAWQDVKRELDRLNKERDEGAAAVRRLELERLDRMLAAIWTQVIAGSYGAIDRALRIMERRARFMGLDMPTGIDLTTGGKQIQVVSIEAVEPVKQMDDE